MAEFFLMPQASPTMTVGVIAKWAAAEGDALSPQSIVAQVETDKATMDVEVFDRGFLLKRLAAEGEEVPPGRPIAILGRAANEDITALMAEFAAMGPAAPAAPSAAPVPAPAAPLTAAPSVARPPTASAPEDHPTAAAPAAPAAPPSAAPFVATPTWMGRTIDASIMEPRGTYARHAGIGGSKGGVAGGAPPAPRTFVSPLARAIAADKGVDLARLRGTGPGGRIVAADVVSAPVIPPAAPAWTRPGDTPRRVTQMRKTIARRLTEVHQQVPVFYLTVTFDMNAAVALKEQATARGLKFSYNDLVIKAVAQALREVPAANAAWVGEPPQIVERGGVDLGMAVALPEGLITPVVRDADRKGVLAIAAEARDLATRAKAGQLTAEEYTGSTFTISNLGMMGIEHFTAILNPPEAGILAVGAVVEVPVARGGRLEVGWRMKATLTCDHRVVDGALGARLLAAVRAYLECPALLVLQ